jgi:hypothetical protein
MALVAVALTLQWLRLTPQIALTLDSQTVFPLLLQILTYDPIESWTHLCRHYVEFCE